MSRIHCRVVVNGVKQNSFSGRQERAVDYELRALARRSPLIYVDPEKLPSSDPQTVLFVDYIFMRTHSHDRNKRSVYKVIRYVRYNTYSWLRYEMRYIAPKDQLVLDRRNITQYRDNWNIVKVFLDNPDPNSKPVLTAFIPALVCLPPAPKYSGNVGIYFHKDRNQHICPVTEEEFRETMDNAMKLLR